MAFTRRIAVALCALVTAATVPPCADATDAAAPPAWGGWSHWGDQGDGTYRNPVLPSDYSDLDCIRVGDEYFAISSTMQFSPGMAVLRSRDLVNWTTAGHVVADLTWISPELNWDRMNRYARGVWAGAIRHHAGKFHVYFGTPDEGYFLSTADDAAGPWAPLHRVLAEPGWDDCCPFWDDDGQGWFVGTHFQDGYKTWLFRLSADGRELVREGAVLLHEGGRREANKLYKIDGTYFHFFSEHRGDVGRYVMMRRAESITGPYSEARQLSHAQRDAMEPNQGGLVQTPSGGWFFFTHHGTGAWEGRAASLLPVAWRDGWPILGAPGADGIGTMVWSGKKPVAGGPVVVPQASDEFSAPTLAPQWEWNHQPRAAKWSLTERPGFLRLHAFRTLDGDNLLKAGNTLTLRAVRTAENTVVVRLDLAGLADGQRAGLCHFAAARKREAPAAHSASLGVVQHDGRRTLEFSRDGAFTAGPALAGASLWLRTTWGPDGVSRFAFSEDGEHFAPFGDPYPLAWGSYRGDRIGLFTFNDVAETGHVDIDWLHYDFSGPRPSTANP